MKRVKDKLKSRRGDSIAEVLVALLISAVALVMLASMITTSTNLIRKSGAHLADYYQADSALARMAGDDLPTDSVTIEPDLRKGLRSGTENTVQVYVVENDESVGGEPIAYRLKPIAQ